MGKLYAIGIYEETESGLVRDKTSSIQTSKFHNEFKNLDQTLLETPFYSTMAPNRVLERHPEEEFNTYFKCRLKKQADPDVFVNVVFAIASQTRLTVESEAQNGDVIIDDKEMNFFFRNIKHILEKHPAATQKGATMKDVLYNPFRYTGSDLVFGAIQENLDSVIEIQQDNLSRIIERNEDVISLDKKAGDLVDIGKIWVDDTKKANRRSCC